jgi:tetratricopeptide (TPR) repeat protein
MKITRLLTTALLVVFLLTPFAVQAEPTAYQTAFKQYTAGKHKEALGTLQASGDKNRDSLYLQGLVASKLKKWELARESFAGATELDSGFGKGYSHLGRALLMLNKSKEAVCAASRGVKLAPSGSAYNVLARAFLKSGDKTQAHAAFMKGLELDPKHAWLHNNLGYMLLQEGKDAQAAEHFGEAVKLFRKNAMAHNNLGIAYERLGEREKALEQFKCAIEIRPDYEQALANLARVKKALEKSMPKTQ